MNVFTSLAEWQAARSRIDTGIGFVPTMGALHAGHAMLLDRSRRENEHTVLSIYVNPTQFNNPEDFANYPETLESDLAIAKKLGVSSVLLPRYTELYPDNFRYRVDETEFSRALCGAHRPGHFTGVLTVVMKLLNLVRPDRAYFGEKDFQQLTLVQGMVDAFFMPVDIVAVPTVRDTDGLALSSRNSRLTPEARLHAPRFSRALNLRCSDAEVIALLQKEGFEVDYIETRGGRRYGAVVMECNGYTVRLIDNVSVPAALAATGT